MQKNERPSFIFYKEWVDNIQDLPDDVRLEIYDGIIAYATTGNFPSLKPMAKIAFNFIKGDISRDQVKYDNEVSKRSEAGRLGNLKRWHPDLFKKVESGRLTLEQAEKIIANDRGAINGIANIADNVDDNVNVNEDELWTSHKKSFLNDEQWIYKFCTSKQVSKVSVESLMKQFIEDVELKQDFKSNKELKNHFTNWFKKQKEITPPLQNGLTAREKADAERLKQMYE